MTEQYAPALPNTNIRAARRQTGLIAFLLLLTTALSYLLMLIEPFWYAFFEKILMLIMQALCARPITEAHLAVDSLMQSQLYSSFTGMLSNLISFFLPFYIYVRCVGKKADEMCPLTGGQKCGHLISVFAALQMCAASASVLCESVSGFVYGPLFDSFPSEESVFMTAPELVVSFLSLCVFTPLLEEFVFRGVIFGSLRPFGFGYAAVASALLFGLAHVGPSSMAYALASGLIFSAVREITGSIRQTVILHALNNAVSFLFSYVLPFYANPAFSDTLNYLWNIALCVLAVFGLLHLFSRLKAVRVESQEASLETPIQAFLSVGTVLYILLFLYTTIALCLYGY